MPPKDTKDDLIHAPDGRTWYETAIDEAEKRGRLEAMLRSQKKMLDEIAAAAGYGAGDSYSAATVIRNLKLK